jgi:hypothetical protein
LDESIALVAFSKHSEIVWSKPFDYARIEDLISTQVGLVAGEALCAASFAAVGALPCVFLAHSPSLTKYSNAAAGGAVLSIAVALAVDAAKDSELACAAGFVIGIFTSIFLPRLLGVEHPEDATRAPRTRSKSKWSAAQAPGAAAAGHSTVAALAFALATHAAAEGVVLGAAYGNSIRAGRAALVSILAHNVPDRAGQESEIPNFKGSYLGRFPLVSADFWTSDHLSERSRSAGCFFLERARAEHSR